MPDLTVENSMMCASNDCWEREVPGSGGRTYVVRFEAIFGLQQEARMSTHDYTCTCQHFQLRLKNKDGGYCKHIEAVRSERCGWHATYGGGLDPSPLSEAEREAAEAEGRCPSCGGPAVPVRVAV